tara:strand:+ start:561 stop:1118 length:558 start_codon:yes stop_codon:yes gene_type:complete
MIKILCLGDSLTNGARNEYFRDYPLELSQFITEKSKTPNICINDSVNGETSSEILKRAFKILEKNQFNLILFLGGTNDSKIPIPPKIYEKNIKQLISLAKHKETKIFLGLLPPIYTGLPCYSQKEGNDIIQIYNKILIRLSRNDSIKTVDFSRLDEKYYSDGVHLNYKGYLLMAQKWYRAIKNEI